MEQASVRTLDTFNRVDAYGNTYASGFPAGSYGATLFAKIKAAIPQASTLSGTQSAGHATAHGAALAKAYDRVLIRRDLSAINHAAHSLALMGVTGLEGKFKITDHHGDQALLGSARGFVTNATPLTAQFVQLGLPADFLTTLGTHITQLETDNTAKAGGGEQQAGATGGIAQTVHDASIALHILDTVVRNTYANNPTALAAWVMASHLERAPQKAKAPAPAPEPVAAKA
jgi:hypothetical protein